MILHHLLDRIIRIGDLQVVYADGSRRNYGDQSGPCVSIRIADQATERRLALNAQLALGEVYTDGCVVLEEGSLHDLLTIAADNVENLKPGVVSDFIMGLRRAAIRLWSGNHVQRARANVAHHYDLSPKLYELFLDEDWQYSCAYYSQPEIGIDQAQRDKNVHIASKLWINRTGMRILDVGCGWGGLALYLAEVTDADILGITLSVEQLQFAQKRAAERGLGDRVRFQLLDYRHLEGQFDRIVSVGMFEHVGPVHYDLFFQHLNRLLTPDGVALIHSIGSVRPPSATNPWIEKYIFPGGYIPSLSEVFPSVERAGLWSTDMEIIRLHYAHTLRDWQKRFEAHRKVAVTLYDERFFRMWEFYLVAAEIAFRRMGHMVFQLQLSRSVDALPITRDYMLDWERLEQRRQTFNNEVAAE